MTTHKWGFRKVLRENVKKLPIESVGYNKGVLKRIKVKLRTNKPLQNVNDNKGN